MLYRCNILALVGKGDSPKSTSNKVMIWDDHQTKIISEFKFATPIKNIKLRRDRIFIILSQKIFIFDFDTFKQLDTFDTYDNPNGIFAINADPNVTVIAYPSNVGNPNDKAIGNVRVKCYENTTSSLLVAHKSKIGFLTLNYDGSLLATASEKGTIIRVFETFSGNFIQEVRRGKDKTIISDMCFSKNRMMLAAVSLKGTVHIWSLKECKRRIGEEGGPENKVSILKILPEFLSGGFFQSEWSFAQLKIEDKTNAVCVFTEDNHVIVVTMKGMYYKARIDMEKGGECIVIKKENLNVFIGKDGVNEESDDGNK